MKIAMIAWGSLVWNPDGLQIQEPFKLGGPNLPLEFSRVSMDGRLTLVIDEEVGVDCPTYFAKSRLANLNVAIGNLRLRERTTSTNIGYINLQIGQARLAAQGSASGERLKAWALGREMDAVVWTGLPANFSEKSRVRKPFSVGAGLQHLQSLPSADLDVALRYIHNAPNEVQTPLRRAVEAMWPRPR